MIRSDGTLRVSATETPAGTAAAVESRPRALALANHTQRQRRATTAFGLIVLAAGILSVTYAYVSSEKTFYTSDYGGYQSITEGLLNNYRESFRSTVGAVRSSIAAEYNALFAIPILPFLLVLGESRLSYELGLAATYLLPLTVVIGAIARQLIPRRPQFAFWSGAALLLLTPIAWVPTLRGYPDTGAALAIAVALWAYLHEKTLKHGWQPIVIGVAAATAMLMRRHFAYDVVALFVAIGLDTSARLFSGLRNEPREFVRNSGVAGKRLGLAALATATVLIVIGRPFLYRAFANNYLSLYAAYMSPPLTVLSWYVATYGWVVFAASLTGLVVAVRSNVVDREKTVFIATFGAVSLLEWLFVVRQTGEQYTLHFTPVVVLGLTALAATVVLRSRGPVRTIIVASSSLFLGVNFVWSLTTLGPVQMREARPLFAMNEPPLMRADHDEVGRLISYLREAAPQGEPIYVAASSPVLTAGLLSDAEHALYGWSRSRLNVLYGPQIDSRDSLPLELLLPAQFVVVADPFQQHMGVDKQRVVKAVYDLFTLQDKFASDFEVSADSFMLDGPTSVTVYKRIRPTSLETAMRTLRFIQRDVGERPGGQVDWMVISPFVPFSVRRDLDNKYAIHVGAGHSDAAAHLLYVGQLPARVVINGLIATDAPCSLGTIRVAGVNQDGSIRGIDDASVSLTGGGRFSLTFPRGEAINVLLSISSGNGFDPPCALNIQELTLSAS